MIRYLSVASANIRGECLTTLEVEQIEKGGDLMRRISLSKHGFAAAFAIVMIAISVSRPSGATQQTEIQLPSTPLKFGAFASRFDPDGAFKLEGTGWPALNGKWKRTGDELELVTTKAPKGCEGPGRY